MLSFEIEAHKMINFKIVTFSSNMLSEKVLKNTCTFYYISSATNNRQATSGRNHDVAQGICNYVNIIHIIIFLTDNNQLQ